jgi:hypothetical protein
MKIILASLAGLVVGYAIAKQQYTEKCIEAYDLGWQDHKEAVEVEVSAAAQEADEKAEIKREAEEQAHLEPEEAEYGPDGWQHKKDTQEVTVEAAQALIEHNGYTAYNTPPKPKGPTVATPAISEIPVTITFKEFDNTPPGYEQYVLTYYEGNNILVSQAGKPIKGKDLVRTVGDLLTFKEGEDAIYVRNPKLKMDFEIVRDPNSFTDVDG